MDTTRFKIDLQAVLAARLRYTAAGHGEAKRQWIKEQVRRRVTRKLNDRRRAAEKRGADPADVRVTPREERVIRQAVLVVADAAPPGRWPTVDKLVIDAITWRLGHPDLRGPWQELSREELAELARPGRRLGTTYARYQGEGRLSARTSATVPTTLLWEGRTAALRYTEREVLPRIEVWKRTADDPPTEDDLRRKNEIYEEFAYTIGRIAREGLDHLLPQLPELDPAVEVDPTTG